MKTIRFSSWKVEKRNVGKGKEGGGKNETVTLDFE